MDSIDYHMLAAFRHELWMLQAKSSTAGGDDVIDTVIVYIKSRIDELERKLKSR